MVTLVACLLLAGGLAPTVAGQFQPAQQPDFDDLFVARDDVAPAGTYDGAQRILRFVQISDAHIIDDDAPFPMRTAILDAVIGATVTGSAARPQEEYTDEVLDAVIQTINTRHAEDAFDFVINTGDNIDNQQENELTRFIDNWEGTDTKVGPISGFACVPDGQSESVDDDANDETTACTSLPAELAANNTPLAFGLPWYSAYGNHDGLIQGNAPIEPGFNELAAQFGRYFLETSEYVDLHFQAGTSCAGGSPAGTVLDDFGHGYGHAGDRLCDEDPDNDGYYALALRGVRIIVLDTVNDDFVTANENLAGLFNPHTTIGYDLIGGYAEGAIDPVQWAWLDDQLKGSAAAGELAIIFAHHTLNSMFAEPAASTCGPPGCLEDLLSAAGYKTAQDVMALLTGYPHFAAWIGGHTHEHRVQPKLLEGAASPGFWNVETSSLVDLPQEARIIELWQASNGTAFLSMSRLGHDYQLSKDLAASDDQAYEGAEGGPEDQDVLLWFPVPDGVALEPQPSLPRALLMDVLSPPPTGNGTLLGQNVTLTITLNDTATGELVPGLVVNVTIGHQPPGPQAAFVTDVEGHLLDTEDPGTYSLTFTPTEAATHFATITVPAQQIYPELARVVSIPVTGPTTDDDEDEDSPLGLVPVLAALGVALLAARRRQNR